jgi:hypothetical protein
MTTSFLMGAVTPVFMAIVAILAFVDGKFFPSQMMLKHGIKIGFPLIGSGAFWGNLFFLSMVAHTIGEYDLQWSIGQVVAALFVGGLLSFFAFRFVYMQGEYPDALAGDNQISLAGVVMAIYTALATAALILFLFCTTPGMADIVLVGLMLLFYIPIANNMLLDHLHEAFHFEWCPPIFKEEGFLTTLVWVEAFIFVVFAIKGVMVTPVL